MSLDVYGRLLKAVDLKPLSINAQNPFKPYPKNDLPKFSSNKPMSTASDSTKNTVIERRSRGTETPPPSQQQSQKHNIQSSFGSNLLQTPKMSRKPTCNLQPQQQTPRMLHRQQKVVYDETTSSAYNTGGDSCRSTPNNQHLQQHTELVPPR